MPIKVNSLENTVETQISRQKSSINQYAVLNQIITNKTLSITSSKFRLIKTFLKILRKFKYPDKNRR